MDLLQIAKQLTITFLPLTTIRIRYIYLHVFAFSPPPQTSPQYNASELNHSFGAHPVMLTLAGARCRRSVQSSIALSTLVCAGVGLGVQVGARCTRIRVRVGASPSSPEYPRPIRQRLRLSHLRSTLCVDSSLFCRASPSPTHGYPPGRVQRGAVSPAPFPGTAGPDAHT